jgi:hypothetical protein
MDASTHINITTSIPRDILAEARRVLGLSEDVNGALLVRTAVAQVADRPVPPKLRRGPKPGNARNRFMTSAKADI